MIKNDTKTIVFLWPCPLPYQTPIYETLGKSGHKVHVFLFMHDDDMDYDSEELEGVTYHDCKGLEYKELLPIILDLNPDVAVICGWYHKPYKKVGKYLKNTLKIPVLCKIDTQYLHTLKQKIGFMISKWYIKPYFSHMLVPGVRQFEFAKRLGYDNQHIVLNGLTGNLQIFSTAKIEHKCIKYPKSFLFVGRLVNEKGLDVLLDAWNLIENKNGWTLKIVGKGPLAKMFDNSVGIEYLGYKQQHEITKIAEESGVFVLPSRYEAWALVIQELSSAGLPLLCSDACGAIPHFLINGYNGYVFDTNNVEHLKQRLLLFMSLEDDELYKMAVRSRKLSDFITPEKTAASIISTIL